MATITARVDRKIAPEKRMQYWYSSGLLADDGNPIGAGDVFMIEDSLGYTAKYLYIETEISANLSIRINSQVTFYPNRAKESSFPIRPDLENPITWMDKSMNPIIIGNGDVWILENIRAVSTIEIVNWAGTGAGQEFDLLVM